MKVWVRINHVGWVHIWRSQADYDAAEPSAHFVNGRTDPRWQEVSLSAEARAALASGALVPIEDPGYFSAEDG